MAEPTNTDALHQGNESTEEKQPRSCRGAGLPVERRGPLLGRAGALQVAWKAWLCHQRQPERLGLPAVGTLPRVVFTFYKFRSSIPTLDFYKKKAVYDFRLKDPFHLIVQPALPPSMAAHPLYSVLRFFLPYPYRPRTCWIIYSVYFPAPLARI